jgi:hypothetical protein
MSEKTGRGRFQRLLILTVLAVWGTVLFRVYDEVRDPGETSPPAERHTREATEAPVPMRIPYTGAFSDPFERKQIVLEEEDPVAEEIFDAAPPNYRPEPPPVRLAGVVGHTALLLQHDETVLVQEGDVVRGAEVVIVERDHVVLFYMDHYHTLTITEERSAQAAHDYSH